MPPDETRDTAGVVVYPPLVPLSVLIVGGLADWLAPVDILNRLPGAPRAIVGAALVAGGVALAAAGGRAFRRIGTAVSPLRPTSALAESGIYARLRNPMYVGIALGLLGIVLAFALEWTLLLTLAGLCVLHYGVVLREERYLERKLGDEYRAYMARVPRYGIGGPRYP